MIDRRFFMSLAVVSALATPALAEPTLGQPAPAFQALDANGKTRALSEFRGKTVVLEWFNHECPFVKKYYGAGNMQRQQAAATGKGVVWLTINSSAAGKQGHVNAEQANAILAGQGLPPLQFWAFQRPIPELKQELHDAIERMDLSEDEELELLEESVVAFHDTQRLLAELGDLAA